MAGGAEAFNARARRGALAALAARFDAEAPARCDADSGRLWTLLADYGDAVGDARRARARRAKALRAHLHAADALRDEGARAALARAARAYGAALSAGAPPAPRAQLGAAALLLRAVAAKLADAPNLDEAARAAAAREPRDAADALDALAAALSLIHI